MLPSYRSDVKTTLNYGHMAREEVELWLIIEDPIRARKYVITYEWAHLPGALRPDRIILDNEREIVFSNMSDEDAITAAITILRDIEVPIVMTQMMLEKWIH